MKIYGDYDFAVGVQYRPASRARTPRSLDAELVDALDQAR